MRHSHVVGDMQVNGDGTVDGWCWAPDRMRARVAFEILVDDRVVGSGRADLPRPDLVRPGMADTRHGFWLALPPGAVDPALSCLVSARARDGGQVFGRRRLDPERAAPDPALLAMQATLGELAERLGACWSPAPPAGWQMRAALGSLAASLPSRPGQRGAGVAAARRVLATGVSLPRLARPDAPRATLVLRAAAEPAEMLRRLRTLAPATFALSAETMLIDPGEDARVALLPGLVPGLVLAVSWDEAMRSARGDWLVLLEDAAVPASVPAWGEFRGVPGCAGVLRRGGTGAWERVDASSPRPSSTGRGSSAPSPCGRGPG